MPDDFRFRPATEADYALLARWLSEAHIREWWGDPEEELASIRDMVEGSDSTRPFIIESDGTPVGYIQYWFIGHHQNETWITEHPWLAELPADAVGVDISLGDPRSLGQGLGSAALLAFAEQLRRAGHDTIVIDPDPANARAVRAYSKAGFRPIPHLEGRTKDALLMQYHPRTNAKT